MSNAPMKGSIPTISAFCLIAALSASVGSANAQPYPSSVVGTDFDYIVETDPNAFVRLDYKSQGLHEMPDKRGSAPLRQRAFLFVSTYSDGARIKLAIDADFKTEAAARKEALRYTPRLGKLPTSLRSGVERVVVHKGGENTTAFSDAGLIVLYSDNATKRISTHDLEETVFHEAVHASWDSRYAQSSEWRAAQKQDRGFVSNYAKNNPKGEDLAESALFAYTLLHHPERIPAADAAKVRRAIPARIAFVGTLLPPNKPLFYPVKAKPAAPPAKPTANSKCDVVPTTAAGLSDILSNALMLGLDQDESAVFSFLSEARKKHSTADELIKATVATFGLEEALLRAQIKKHLHCNCDHD